MRRGFGNQKKILAGSQAWLLRDSNSNVAECSPSANSLVRLPSDLRGDSFMNAQVLALGAVALLSLSIVAQTTQPREHFDHATVKYDWITNASGEKLRTFVTRPNNDSDKV